MIDLDQLKKAEIYAHTMAGKLTKLRQAVEDGAPSPRMALGELDTCEQLLDYLRRALSRTQGVKSREQVAWEYVQTLIPTQRLILKQLLPPHLAHIEPDWEVVLGPVTELLCELVSADDLEDALWSSKRNAHLNKHVKPIMATASKGMGNWLTNLLSKPPRPRDPSTF